MCVLLPEAGATCVSYIVENCCWHKGTRTNILSSYKFSSFSSSDECQWQLVKRNSYWAHIHFYTIKWGNLELRSSKLISETYKREPGPWNKTSHWPEWSVHFFFKAKLLYFNLLTNENITTGLWKPSKQLPRANLAIKKVCQDSHSKLEMKEPLLVELDHI